MNIQIKVKVPDLSLFSGKEFVDRIAEAQRKLTAPALKELFNQTTEGWEHEVQFDQKQEIRPYSISMTVFTRNWRYKLVNDGSPSHTILPKQKKMLRFQRGYRAATRPRTLSSSAKRRWGGYESSLIVNHPGFEAREFDKTAAEEHYPDFVQDMQDAMRIK